MIRYYCSQQPFEFILMNTSALAHVRDCAKPRRNCRLALRSNDEFVKLTPLFTQTIRRELSSQGEEPPSQRSWLLARCRSYESGDPNKPIV